MAFLIPGNATERTIFATPAEYLMNQGTDVEWRFIRFKLNANPTLAANRGIFSFKAFGVGVGGMSINASENVAGSVRGQDGINSQEFGALPTAGTEIRALMKHDYNTNEYAWFYQGALVASGTVDVGTNVLSKNGARLIELAGLDQDGIDIEILEFGCGTNGLPTDQECVEWTAGTRGTGNMSAAPDFAVTPIGNSEVTTFDGGGFTFTQSQGPISPSSDTPSLTGQKDTAFAITSVTDEHSGGGGHTMSVTDAATDLAFLGRRKADRQLRFTVAGTYSGADTPSSIRARIGTGGFASPVSETISGGSFTATFEIVGHGYGLEIASADDLVTTVLAMPGLRAGDFYLVAGQSNAAGQINDNDPGDPLPSVLGYGSTLYSMNNSGVVNALTSTAVDFVTKWAAARIQEISGVPICYHNIAVGASSLYSWRAGQSSYTAGDDELANRGIKGHANAPSVFWNQGESGVGGGSEDYETEFLLAFGEWKTNWGIRDVYIWPVYVQKAATVFRKMAREHADIHCPAITDQVDLLWNEYRTDNLHLESPRDAIEIAAMLFPDVCARRGYTTNPVVPPTQGLFVGSKPVQRVYLGGDLL